MSTLPLTIAANLSVDTLVTALLAAGEQDVAAAVAQYATAEDLAADVWTAEEAAAIDRAIRSL